MPRPFHLAFPCSDIAQTRRFYCELLGAGIGRTADSWIDLDFFGHQLVFHHCGGETLPKYYNPVDNDQVPLPHFGVILAPENFDAFAARITGHVEFVIEPTTRFAGTRGEQRTMFFLDPDSYALEFKSFADDRFIFSPFESDDAS